MIWFNVEVTSKVAGYPAGAQAYARHHKGDGFDYFLLFDGGSATPARLEPETAIAHLRSVRTESGQIVPAAQPDRINRALSRVLGM